MITWFTGDVFDGLATLEDGSVDLVVTSPPFLALRSYLPADHPDKGKEIGSEATPAEFLDVMLRVTAELGRVLAPHGSIAVELGDTYAGNYPGDQYTPPPAWRDGRGQPTHQSKVRIKDDRHVPEGWPLDKSKTLIPELYRIALAYGFNPLTGEPSPAGRWRVRNVVTWCRPNPPVGALGDKWRPATSDIVVACRSGKRYWDDLATRKQSVRGPRPGELAGRNSPKSALEPSNARHPTGGHSNPEWSSSPLLDYWEIPLLDGEEPKPYGPEPKPKGHARIPKGAEPRTDLPSRQRGGNWASLPERNDDPNGPGAPLLDYWEIPPTGYAGAHYAVYPPALVEPLVKAMCPEKVCRTCGEPSRRIVERERVAVANDSTRIKSSGNVNGWEPPPEEGWEYDRQTAGFTDCGHDDWRHGIVLDPFAGSGTTLAVASGHGHDAIGIDLDPRNEELARERVGPLMWEVDGV